MSGGREAAVKLLRSGEQLKTMIGVSYGNSNGNFDMFARGLSLMRLLNVLADHISDELVLRSRSPWTWKLAVSSMQRGSRRCAR